MKCAFIVSPSYSGSTLLSMLLAHHPGLATLGEFLNSRTRGHRDGEGDFCSCGERLPSCPFMSDLTRKVRASGIEFSIDFPDTAFRSTDLLTDRILRGYIRGPVVESFRRGVITALPWVRRTLERIVQRNTQVISTVLEMEEASVYLDSAKNNNRVIYFDRYGNGIDVKVIWLIRDGRGVVNSIKRHSGRDTAAATSRWVTTQRSVNRAVGYLPAENVMTMKYEDLCANPAHWLPETCRFLGLDPVLLPETYGGADVHLTGNNMRLKGLGEIRLDEKWRTALSPEDLAIFERIGGGLNRELGYAEDA